MSAIAQESRGDRRATKPRTSRQRHPTARKRVAGGVAWIVVVAALLAGVVALNVAVLRLNLRLDDLGQERAQLRAENAALASKLASAASTARIQRMAQERLGVAPADPSQTTYVHIRR